MLVYGISMLLSSDGFPSPFLPVCLSIYCFACVYSVHSIFQIIDIPKKTFPKLYELHTIDFSHNNITQIDRSVFVNLLSLRQLNFRHNHLEVIESSTFGKLPTLLSLDFSHNRLKRVKRGAFGGLASLRSINLGKITINNFDILYSYFLISFSENNELTEIPSVSISLTTLYLANNNISKIKGRAPWPVMNSLIYIDLDNNQLGDSLDGGRCINQ